MSTVTNDERIYFNMEFLTFQYLFLSKSHEII